VEGGVVIVRTEDAGKVVNFLKGFGAEVYAWTVVLRHEDEKTLAQFRPKSARPTGGSLTLPQRIFLSQSRRIQHF